MGTISASSKNSTYAIPFNIISVKTANGGTTWTKQDGTAGFDQVTTDTTSGVNSRGVQVLYNSNSLPVIVYVYNTASTYAIKSVRYTTSWQNPVTVYTSGSGTYAQFFPKAILKKYGSNINRIVVKWYGTDSTDTSANNQRVAYSDDLGATYNLVGKIS